MTTRTFCNGGKSISHPNRHGDMGDWEKSPVVRDRCKAFNIRKPYFENISHFVHFMIAQAYIMWRHILSWGAGYEA